MKEYPFAAMQNHGDEFVYPLPILSVDHNVISFDYSNVPLLKAAARAYSKKHAVNFRIVETEQDVRVIRD